MNVHAGHVLFSLYGPFRVSLNDAKDLTPKSAKAQGLLLLLVQSPHGRRGRRWLQDKLWSDRAAEQGANSLRQELSQIRKTLGPLAHVIGADRQNVWLNMAEVSVDLSRRGEFAEGLDVRDPEFEYWLTAERLRLDELNRPESAAEAKARADGIAPAKEKLRISVDASSGQPDSDEWLEMSFADSVVRHLEEQFNVAFEHSALFETSLTLQLRSKMLTSGTSGLRATLLEGQSRRQIWSQHRVVEADRRMLGHHPTVVQLGAELADGLATHLVQSQASCVSSADTACFAGIRHLFAFTPRDVATAESLFLEARGIENRGLYWAWLAQVRTIQRVEIYSSDLKGLRAEGEYFAARALELEPNNSMVLALCSNAEHILRMDAQRGLELADRAVHINPYNPMAWWALSSSKLYAGDAEQSYREALRARYLTAKSPLRFWWDLQVFAAAMMTGRMDEAVQCLKSCAAQNPNFRPPLRYLLALLAALGDEAAAQRIIDALLALEPDFSIKQLVEDKDYPASLLHRAPGMDLERVQAVLK